MLKITRKDLHKIYYCPHEVFHYRKFVIKRFFQALRIPPIIVNHFKVFRLSHSIASMFGIHVGDKKNWEAPVNEIA